MLPPDANRPGRVLSQRVPDRTKTGPRLCRTGAVRTLPGKRIFWGSDQEEHRPRPGSGSVAIAHRVAICTFINRLTWLCPFPGDRPAGDPLFSNFPLTMKTPPHGQPHPHG